MYPDITEDMCLVIDEWTKPKKDLSEDIDRREAQKLKKKLRKLAKKGRVGFKVDSQMKWRLCAARLMRAKFDEYAWQWFQYRSDWALNHAKFGHQWRKHWTGGNCDLRVLMEQGIGDEIMYASTFSELIDECPDVKIEIDSRLIPVMQRSFGDYFVSRWIHGDDDRRPPAPEDYDERGIEFDYYVCGADLLKRYRTNKNPPGTPFLKTNPEYVGKYKDLLSQYPKPWIGISWKGGRSNIQPEVLRKKEGTYINIQYGRRGRGEYCWLIDSEQDVPEWIKPVPVNHNDMDQVFALCEAVDEVVCTQNYIVHVCGSIGKKCTVKKPPPQFGPVGDDLSTNNRLKWNYGLGGKHPWYNSVWVSV